MTTGLSTVNGTAQKDLKENIEEEGLVALMQRSSNGTFYFSSACPESIANSVSTREISKIRIIPSDSLEKSSNLRASSFISNKRHRSSDDAKFIGIHRKSPNFLFYGSFTSFAPNMDSSAACLSTFDGLIYSHQSKSAQITRNKKVPAFNALPVYRGKKNSSDTALDIDLAKLESSSGAPPSLHKDNISSLTPKDVLQVLSNTSCKNVDPTLLLEFPAKYASLKKTSAVPMFVTDLIEENKVMIDTLIRLQRNRMIEKASNMQKDQSESRVPRIVNSNQKPANPASAHNHLQTPGSAQSPKLNTPLASGSPKVLITSGSNNSPYAPTDYECALAETLMRNLTTLARWIPPSQLSAGVVQSDEYTNLQQMLLEGSRESCWLGAVAPHPNNVPFKAVADNRVGGSL